jgi:hypothetical protein
MKETESIMPDQTEPSGDCYEIRLQGCLDEHWASWFGGMTLTTEPCGETILLGRVPDQSALQCLLRKVHELGLALISVRRCREDQISSSK